VADSEETELGVEAGFTKPELNASPCEFQFKLPSFSFGLIIPPFKFPPFDIPIPRFKLALSCDLSNPIDVSVGLDFGGGRVATFDPNPDDDDSF
jgi:hypothetical protein